MASGQALLDVVDATWAPARMDRLGPWILREGAGGGQRVSAASLLLPAADPVTPADIAAAETAMRGFGQTPLFRIGETDGDHALDAMLDASGYRIGDRVVLYTLPTARLTDRPVPPVSAFDVWPPLAIMGALWQTAGIDAGRQAVMARTARPKTTILARQNDRPAGVAFVACDGNTAMIHALEVVPDLRRLGVGTNIMRKAAHWAQDNGATCLALAVTRANLSANALYSSLGMTVAGYYHYRIKQGRNRSEQSCQTQNSPSPR